MSNPDEKQKKLTIEDLVRSQMETEKHLLMLTNATYRRKDFGIGTSWFLLAGPVWFFCQGNPVAQQVFSSLCLFVITGLLLCRGYGLSPAMEFEEAENTMKARERTDKRLIGFGSYFTYPETPNPEPNQK